MAYASAGDSSGGFGDWKARQCQQKTKQSSPTEINKGIVTHRYFWKKKRQMENQFMNKELEKNMWSNTPERKAIEEKGTRGTNFKSVELQKYELQNGRAAKALYCKKAGLQKCWVAKVLSCKSNPLFSGKNEII